jgi:hypothetical protein
MFKSRKMVIATMHNKEQVIKPILESNLGCICIVPPDFNTDQLGTFSGEIERESDPISTARKKCELAMNLTDTDMAVSSEGSFGQHPSIFFAHADDEFLLFVDRKNDLEIIVRELTLETNFNGGFVENEKELIDFAERAKFPSHGLILRKSSGDLINMTKGIVSYDELIVVFQSLKRKFGKVHIETDMRALYNPTRMKVIGNLTQKLVDKINFNCPNCSTPGFGKTDVKLGLPCDYCSFPTKSIKSHIYSCTKCAYSEEKKFPFDKLKEDPMFCDICNP